jgi:hypothetical protein
MAKTVLLYGDSGTFKTTALAHAARYLYRKHKKPLRLITSEESQPLQPYVEAGIVEIFRLDLSVDNPLSTLTKLCRGEWPNSAGKLALATGPLPTAGYLFEGLTSCAELLLQDLCNTHRKISQDPIGSFTEDGEKFCAAAPSHYGFVQNTMLARIKSLAALDVDRVIITAHEGKGEEEGSRNAIRGPGLVGNKGTDKVGKLVGTMIHAEDYMEEMITIDPKNKDRIAVYRPKVRYFFVKHPDQKFPNVSYPAKPRVPPERYEELMKIWPGGFFTPTLEEGLDTYLEVDDRLFGGTVDALISFKAEVDKI